MLKLKDKNIKMYRGDYRPVRTIENGKNLGGYSRQSVTNDREIYTDTYNDSLDLFGKNGYKPHYNLCPPLNPYELHKEINGEDRYVKIIPNQDGTFNFVGNYDTVTIVGYVALPPGTYTASGSAILRMAPDASQSNYFELPYTFTLTRNSTAKIVIYNKSKEYCELENQYIQFECGETATEFRPYCGGATNNVTVLYPKVIVGSKADIKTWCKNLLDISSIRGMTVIKSSARLTCDHGGNISAQGTSNGELSFWGLPDLHLPVGEYVLSATGDATDIKCDVFIRDKDGEILATVMVDASLTQQIINLADYPEYDYLGFNIYRLGGEAAGGSIRFQLEEGSEPTEYEISYGSSEMSCPELFGIEVTADDPYNYTETVDGTKKYYICDSIEGNKLTRRIGKVVFNGNEDDWYTGTCASSGHCIYERKNDDARGNLNVMCSHFTQVADIANQKNCYIANCPDEENNIKFMYSKWSMATLEIWKQWLSNQYVKGVPVTVYYVLTEPTTEILTERLKTYPKSTYISLSKPEDNSDYGIDIKITD